MLKSLALAVHQAARLLPAMLSLAVPVQAGEAIAGIKARGELRCGVSEGIAGFSKPDPAQAHRRLGGRDDLVKKDVVFDADIYWAPQAITGGGKDGATPSLVPVHAGTIEAAPRRAFSVLLAIFPHPIRALGW